jgi:hypothetical protein
MNTPHCLCVEIAERYNAPQLKGFCMYFLLKEFDAVSKTEAFQNLSPDVIEEIRKHKKLPTASSSKKSKDESKFLSIFNCPLTAL